MNKMAIRIKQLAFTIIELLFVIAIIGVILSIGLSLYQRQMEKTKISKAAIEIQHILQAADVYYINNGSKWPDASNTSQCPTPTLCDYLPAPQAPWYNPWGYPYEWYITTRPKMNLFTVRTQTPNINIAKQLSTKLPNTSPDSDAKVTSLIAPPGPPPLPTGAKVYFGGIGITHGSTCLINQRDFNCPTVAPNPTIKAAIANFTTHEITIFPGIKIPSIIRYFSYSVSNCSEGNKTGKELKITCEATTTACDKAEFVYVVSCSP